ncbi:hypothetical protein COP1_047413 [Malus domestica]
MQFLKYFFTSIWLAFVLLQGISSIIGAIAHDLGIITTPQLHWMVRARNKGLQVSDSDYFKQLSSSFRLVRDRDLIPSGNHACSMDDKLIWNCGKEGGVLNEGAGAGYVQKEKVAPCSFGSQDVGIRSAVCYLDDDADRLVYFIVPSRSNNKIELVDGDKIFSFFAIFIKKQLSIYNKEVDVNGITVISVALDRTNSLCEWSREPCALGTTFIHQGATKHL